MTDTKYDWQFSRKFIPIEDKKSFTCIALAEESASRALIIATLKSFSQLKFILEDCTINGILDKIQEIPDLAVLQLNITGSITLKTISNLKQCFPGILILVTGKYNEPNLIQRIFMAGAAGYLHQDFMTMHLDEGMRSLVAGKVYIGNQLFSALLETILREKTALSGLTEKEFDIFILFGRGLNPAAIAGETGLSVSSILVCLKSIRACFGFTRTRQLLEHATGWVRQNL